MLTPLRESHRRAGSLCFEAQLHECVEQLQHPELIANELLTSHAQVSSTLREAKLEPLSSQSDVATDRSRAFYPSRDIFVVRDSASFTCLAVDVQPLPVEVDDEEQGHDGLDYLAITCTGSPSPVLGVVQPSAQVSAYPLLLRLFSGLCELAHDRQIVRLDRDCFRGMLGPAPRFDLHLVLWDDWIEEDAAPERAPISQLTRDLAERAKQILCETDAFPPVLGDIVCLNMNPHRFDGRVRFDWRV